MHIISRGKQIFWIEGFYAEEYRKALLSFSTLYYLSN